MALWLVAVVVTAAVGVVVPSGVAGAGSNNTISGTVSAEGGGPLVGIDVRLYAWPSGSVVGVRTSDVSGGYSFAGLADGAYRVKFSDQVAGAWVTEFHAGASSLASASDVVVSGGAATVIDAALTPAGSISGVVTDHDTELPLAGMQVRLFREPGRVVVAQRFTAADGSYAFANPGSGTYRVRFLDPGATYLTEFWDDKPYYSQAGDLVLAPGTHLTADAGMRAPTSISGTVTDESTAAPLAGLEVRLYREPGRVVVANATTAADGSYTFANPGVGTYRLRFSDPVGGVYPTEFHDDAPNYAAASDVVVAAGASVDVDAQLQRPAQSFTVNVATDGVDAVVGDGICEVTAGAGNCSLRAAVMEANVHPALDQITIAPGIDPTLTLGGLDIDSDLTLDGNGATVWCAPFCVVFDIAGRTVGFDDVSIGSGQAIVASSVYESPLEEIRAPAISLDRVHVATTDTPAVLVRGGSLDMTRSTIDGSSSSDDSTIELSNEGDAEYGVIASIDRSSVVGSQADDLSLLIATESQVTVTNSTMVSLGDHFAAIGIDEGDGVLAASLTIIGSTVSAAGEGGVFALLGAPSSLFLTSSVVQSTGPVCQTATATSGGYNIVSDNWCGLSGPGDLQGTDALLGPLADNGGPTHTMLPGVGSPAIDHIPVGTPGLCDGTLPTDQRGVLRPLGAGCDAGSVEQ